MEVFQITIITINDEGKQHTFRTEESDLIKATRIVLTYQPKRNYELDEIQIVKGFKLF